MSIDLLALSGDAAQIYASLPFGPIAPPVESWGPIWVSLGALVVLGTFAVPASEHVGLSFLLPNDPIVQGRPLSFQALTLTPVFDDLRNELGESSYEPTGSNTDPDTARELRSIADEIRTCKKFYETLRYRAYLEAAKHPAVVPSATSNEALTPGSNVSLRNSEYQGAIEALISQAGGCRTLILSLRQISLRIRLRPRPSFKSSLAN